MVETIVLKSSDGESFEVDEVVAFQSETIMNLVRDKDRTGDGILILDVTGEILNMVIEYCKKHVADTAKDDEELKSWDADFIKMDWNTLASLTYAAHYLKINTLLDLLCQAVANMIKGKSPQEIRNTFNIKNEFTPEEEAEILENNRWAFD